MNLLATFFVLLTISPDAAAYLDPGTGSLILQGFIAALAVGGLAIKTYWYKLKSWFSGGSHKSSLLDEEDEPDDRSDT